MHSGSVHDRTDLDLDGYGDLSSFAPKASLRNAVSEDEASALALIMGGDDFAVGDGTLEFQLKAEDHELVRPIAQSAPVVEPRDDFEPIEARYPDPGDAVAKQAVSDALMRLESLAGEAIRRGNASEETAVASPVEETRVELSESATDELLGGGYGGMGSADSEAPTPFALPKLPASYSQYPPQVIEAAVEPAPVIQQVTTPGAASIERSREMMRMLDADLADEPVADQLPPATSEASAEDFSPFEIREERREDTTFDTRETEVPAYARQAQPVRHDLDSFMPPPEAQVAVARETRPSAAYSQPRIETREVEDELLEEQLNAQEETESEFEAAAEADHAEEVVEETAPAMTAPDRPSILKQYWMQIAGAALVLGLVGAKQFMMPAGDGAGEAAVATPAAVEGEPVVPEPIERDYARGPIDGSFGNVVPQSAQAPVANPIVEEAARTVQTTMVSTPSHAPAAVLQAQLADLAQRMTALESERDKLREENQLLKKQPAAPKAVKKTVVAKKEFVVTEEALVHKPARNIQYLGSFRDGDRLVAEVLIDGNLERLKRGDSVNGIRVDAVGDMSVTIDGTAYSP